MSQRCTRVANLEAPRSVRSRGTQQWRWSPARIAATRSRTRPRRALDVVGSCLSRTGSSSFSQGSIELRSSGHPCGRGRCYVRHAPRWSAARDRIAARAAPSRSREEQRWLRQIPGQRSAWRRGTRPPHHQSHGWDEDQYRRLSPSTVGAGQPGRRRRTRSVPRSWQRPTPSVRPHQMNESFI